MRNKEVEDRIRKSIDIESRDFLDKLLEYPVEKRTRKSKLKYIRWGMNFCTVCVFVFALFLTKNMWNKESKLSPNNPSIIDNIQFNEVIYDKGEVDKNIDENSYFRESRDLEYLNSRYSLDISPEKFLTYDLEVDCYSRMQTNVTVHCNIILNKNDYQSRVYIGIKNNEFPIFNDEIIDMWEQQENFNQYNKSQIQSKELILLEDNANSFNNYKTKFKINDLGIAVDSYEIEKEEFIDILKIIIDNFK